MPRGRWGLLQSGTGSLCPRQAMLTYPLLSAGIMSGSGTLYVLAIGITSATQSFQGRSSRSRERSSGTVALRQMEGEGVERRVDSGCEQLRRFDDVADEALDSIVQRVGDALHSGRRVLTIGEHATLQGRSNLAASVAGRIGGKR